MKVILFILVIFVLSNSHAESGLEQSLREVKEWKLMEARQDFFQSFEEVLLEVYTRLNIDIEQASIPKITDYSAVETGFTIRFADNQVRPAPQTVGAFILHSDSEKKDYSCKISIYLIKELVDSNYICRTNTQTSTYDYYREFTLFCSLTSTDEVVISEEIISILDRDTKTETSTLWRCQG